MVVGVQINLSPNPDCFLPIRSKSEGASPWQLARILDSENKRVHAEYKQTNC
jgi:hypothetical protein